MAIIATDSGGTFTQAPEGTHRAICVQVIDIGTQHSKFYGTSSHKVLVGWELPDETYENKEQKTVPHMVWKRYTLSTNEKAALRHDLESWRGRKFTAEEIKAFDLKNILDKPCLVNIVHRESDGKTYANVAAVSAMAKGMEAPKRTRDIILFDINDFNKEVFDTFSENLQQSIMGSKEMVERSARANNGSTGNSHQGNGDWSDVRDDEIGEIPPF